MNLARLQNGLLADDAIALHFADSTDSIVDKPVTPKQLHGMIAAVLNRNMIPKNELALLWIGVLGQVLGLYRNRDSVCRQYFHGGKLRTLAIIAP